MTIFGIHFHSWTKVFTKYSTKYRGRFCTETYCDTRFCKECGKHQIYDGWDYWRTATECETNILKQDIKLEDGKYYLKEFNETTNTL